MVDLTKSPLNFEDARQELARQFRVREKVLEPCVFIEEIDKSWKAVLGGTRKVGGEERILLAPTNLHSWVVDNGVLFPLPVDAPKQFLDVLKGSPPDDLPYKRVVQLAEQDVLDTRYKEAILASGAESALNYPNELEIDGLKADLYPYQSQGVQWLWDTLNASGGAILADEMGLGKTLQVIALLLIDPPPHDKPALIVCPTSLITNWVRELEKFAPSLLVDVHRGPDRTGVYHGLQMANVVISTYDTMVNDIAIFSAFEWSWVICDEAQALKNPDSARRKSIARIPRRKSLPMTGTPVENSLLDLWSLVDFAIPGLLGERGGFEARFPDSTSSATRLNAVVDPIVLKRRVEEVADDLPERIDINAPIDMSENLRSHYLKVRQETLDKYPVAGALVATLQLQLVCSHPWLVCKNMDADDGEDAIIADSPDLPLMNEKMDVIISLLREAFLSGKKVLVFAIFNRLGDLIRVAGSDLPAAYWGAINGSTPQAERQNIIDDFSDHDGPGCLVLNPKAAGAGLNITAATIVIHTSPVWNPALEAQASARAHRRGQDLPVTIYRLFYEGTVERVMLDRSLWKAEMGNEIAPVSTRDSADLKRALEIEPDMKWQK
ncbi:DEAD/DEAH box helicase [Aliiroseovarius sp. CAU 1755]